MLELSRTVRFCLDAEGDLDRPRHNTFTAWPAPRGLARYFELTVTCRGAADPKTGYFINIRDIDTAVRKHALPLMARAAGHEARQGPAPMGALMHRIGDALQADLDRTVCSVELHLTPRTSLTALAQDMPESVLLKQCYEFSAAHRLHVPEFSDERNHEIFGKCNNPAGHGHNYTVQVVVRAPVDAQGRSMDVAELDQAVDTHVIVKLDHKHLNRDVPQFADLNPSVEHIAAVIWGMLETHVPSPGSLTELSVWETGKTVCTYRGPAPASV